MSAQPAYWPDALIEWAGKLFVARGTDAPIAATVAGLLVEGDLLGHDTHGLNLLGPYLRKIDQGILKPSGSYEVISDRPAAQLWDGGGLAGPWLTAQAVEAASARARETGTAAITIRRSGHIGCLAAYLEKPAREGFLIEIMSSDPSEASVAPFGGLRATFTPNPMAFAIPTSGDPIMIDISTSITTNGMSARLRAAGERFPGNWLLDGQGRPTDDPEVFGQEPRGTIQLLGGRDAGHKGYGLTLLVEAMTGGLAGYGRADEPSDWGATVMVRATDPATFGGLDAFNAEIDWLVEACLGNPPIDPGRPVRMPGQRGLALKRHALHHGLVLNAAVQTEIERLAKETGIALPGSVAER